MVSPATSSSVPIQAGRQQPVPASLHRRRVMVLVGAVLAVMLVGTAIVPSSAEAELADRVAGHVVVAPGETLWQVAVATAPDGVDPRAQLAAIEQLNGIGASDVQAWQVVLLPAR